MLALNGVIRMLYVSQDESDKGADGDTVPLLAARNFEDRQDLG